MLKYAGVVMAAILVWKTKKITAVMDYINIQELFIIGYSWHSCWLRNKETAAILNYETSKNMHLRYYGSRFP